MQGIWSQVVTLAVILHIALVTGKALIQQNQQKQQLERKDPNANSAQERVGYDYPAPPHDLDSPYQDDHDDIGHHEEHHVEHHHHHDDHDPGYWKKKLIWRQEWKKIWKPANIQIWRPSWKKIWKPVWVPIKVQVWKCKES